MRKVLRFAMILGRSVVVFVVVFFCGDFVVLMVVICGAEDTFGLAWGCVRCGPHIA